jgi:hypothetical protein
MLPDLAETKKEIFRHFIEHADYESFWELEKMFETTLS